MLLLSLTLLAAGTPAAATAAEHTEVDCVAIDKTLPESLKGWMHEMAAPTTLDASGHAWSLKLSPNAAVRYAAPPEKQSGAESFGGTFPVHIAWAGKYAVALGAGAWIDIVKDGEAIGSTSHQHGPTCSTIRKIVVFDLTPGHYVLQISGSKTTAIKATVVSWQ